MNIDYLKYFVEVSKTKSISLAAKSYHITQSALSQQLSKLEQDLNIKLLERSNKGVTLTPEGKQVLQYCETILSTYDKMLDNISNLSQSKSLIIIEAIEPLSTQILPKAISTTKSENLKYNIVLKNSNDFNITNLTNNICDMYLSYKNYNIYDNIISKKIGKDKLLLVGHKSYPVNEVNIYDFLYLPFIFNENFDISYLTKNYNIDDLNILYKTNSFFSIINGLCYSKSVTILPQSIYNIYNNSHDLKIINVLDFNLELDIYVNYTEYFYKNNINFIKPFVSLLKEIMINL